VRSSSERQHKDKSIGNGSPSGSMNRGENGFKFNHLVKIPRNLKFSQTQVKGILGFI